MYDNPFISLQQFHQFFSCKFRQAYLAAGQDLINQILFGFLQFQDVFFDGVCCDEPVNTYCVVF